MSRPECPSPRSHLCSRWHVRTRWSVTFTYMQCLRMHVHTCTKHTHNIISHARTHTHTHAHTHTHTHARTRTSTHTHKHTHTHTLTLLQAHARTSVIFNAFLLGGDGAVVMWAELHDFAAKLSAQNRIRVAHVSCHSLVSRWWQNKSKKSAFIFVWVCQRKCKECVCAWAMHALVCIAYETPTYAVVIKTHSNKPPLRGYSCCTPIKWWCVKIKIKFRVHSRVCMISLLTLKLPEIICAS